eukprot:15465618-Alexandrium_andersonii.AAC.1
MTELPHRGHVRLVQAEGQAQVANILTGVACGLEPAAEGEPWQPGFDEQGYGFVSRPGSEACGNDFAANLQLASQAASHVFRTVSCRTTATARFTDQTQH